MHHCFGLHTKTENDFSHPANDLSPFIGCSDKIQLKQCKLILYYKYWISSHSDQNNSQRH